MIVSHSSGLVLLEPTYTQASRLYLRMIDGGLVNDGDTATGIYTGESYIDGYEPINCEMFPRSMTDYMKTERGEYFKKTPFMFNQEGFLGYVWSAMSLSEAVEMGVLTHRQAKTYKVISVIRNPMSRLLAAFKTGHERKRIRASLQAHINGTWSIKLHHLWKNQTELCDIPGVNPTYVLFEDFSTHADEILSGLPGYGLPVDRPKALVVDGEISTPLNFRGFPKCSRDIFETWQAQDSSVWQSLLKARLEVNYTEEDQSAYFTQE